MPRSYGPAITWPTQECQYCNIFGAFWPLRSKEQDFARLSAPCSSSSRVNISDESCPTPRLPAHFGSFRSHKQLLSHVASISVADEASVGPLLCTMKFQQQRHGAAQHAWRMPDFDTIGWYGQAMAALAAAMVFGKLRRKATADSCLYH